MRVEGLRQYTGVRWSFPLDCATALGVVVVANRVVVTCRHRKIADKAQPARVYAIDLQSGRELWRVDLSVVKVSRPSTDGRFVYLGADSELLALDAPPRPRISRLAYRPLGNAL